MKNEKTKYNFFALSKGSQKKGWGLGIDQKSKAKKLGELIESNFSESMKRK